MHNFLRIPAILLCSLVLIHCGGTSEKPAETARTGPVVSPDEANGGTITGKVAFAGEKPKMATLDMSANPAASARTRARRRRAKKWWSTTTAR